MAGIARCPAASFAPNAARRRAIHRRGPIAAAVAESPPADAAYAPELAAAAGAVVLAARLTRAVQASVTVASSPGVHQKADASPVTVADYGAQALVTWALLQSPGIGTPHQSLSLVAEEDASDLRSDGRLLAAVAAACNETLAGRALLSPADVLDLIDLGGSPGGPTGRHWVLDPIDGTKGYVAGRQYAIALGMIENGVVRLGVLGCPALHRGSVAMDSGMPDSSPRGVLFTAAGGRPATARPLLSPGEDSRITDSGMPDSRMPDSAPCRMAGAPRRLLESVEGVCGGAAAHAAAAAVSSSLGLESVVRMDSQAKYGALARGDAALYLRFPEPGYREKIWDHAAGVAVVLAAGGVVTDAGGAPLDFSRGRHLDLDRGIVAGSAGVHAEALAAIAAARGRGS